MTLVAYVHIKIVAQIAKALTSKFRCIFYTVNTGMYGGTNTPVTYGMTDYRLAVVRGPSMSRLALAWTWYSSCYRRIVFA